MTTSTHDHVRTLDEDGIVIIQDYFDEEECDDAREEIEAAIESDQFTNGDGWSTDRKLNADEPVINHRGGADEGMIDIFNIDELVELAARFKNDDFIHELVNNTSSKSHSVQSTNVYFNRDVTSTRDYHADTYGDKFKAFLYLTDVPSDDYGPYSYIKGSHKQSFVTQRISQLINTVRGNPKTNAMFYDESDIVNCTAPKGTLIISNQSGYHRGIPQQPGHERMLLNLHITPN